MKKKANISVIIPTRNRAKSLYITLNCLGKVDSRGIDYEIIVVDNASTDKTPEVVHSRASDLPVRYLYEQTTGSYGKSHALNRALDEGTAGDLIVVLDDDMEPHADWLKGIIDITGRWPDMGFFTGKSYVIWPETDIPAWCRNPAIRSWAYSVFDWGKEDKVLPPGGWFSGNHFWFRASLISSGRRFRDLWLTEPDFMLRLSEDGHQGVYGPDAVAGHRIQEELLDFEFIKARAIKVGASFSQLRMNPEFPRLKHVRLFRNHPLGGRIVCFVFFMKWAFLHNILKLAKKSSSGSARFIVALERTTAFKTFLAEAARHPQYDIFRNLKEKKKASSTPSKKACHPDE